MNGIEVVPQNRNLKAGLSGRTSFGVLNQNLGDSIVAGLSTIMLSKQSEPLIILSNNDINRTNEK